jgi:uncharacterized protein involved in type VI secretion and phage assembly
MPKYIIDIGQVTKVMPHKGNNDGANYQCDVLLRDSGNSLTNVPVASPRMGFACIPEVDDQVLVGFIRGHLHMPVILGTLYNDKVKPPLYLEGEAVYVCPEYKQKQSSDPKMEELKRFYMELPKHKMKLVVREEDVHYELLKYKFDLKKEEGIKLEVNEKTSLAISKEGDITITAKDTKISINKEGEIAIDSKQKVGIKTTAEVSLESSGGDMKLTANNITLKGNQAVKIEGTQSVEIKGMNAKIEANTQLDIKGAMATVEASGTMDVKSSGVLSIKGSLVKIN